MAKVQVSTVRQEANVEVMFLNASLISRVIRAQNTLRHVFEGHIDYLEPRLANLNVGTVCAFGAYRDTVPE